MDIHDRSFTVVHANGKEHGRFVAKTPARAAQKAGNEILKETKKSAVDVSIRETTRGAKSREPRAYRIQRQRKTAPVSTEYATFKFDVTSKSLNRKSKSKSKSEPSTPKTGKAGKAASAPKKATPKKAGKAASKPNASTPKKAGKAASKPNASTPKKAGKAASKPKPKKATK
jgi:hypothetical protein